MHAQQNMYIIGEEMFPNASSNDSFLWKINDEMATTLIPPIVYVGVLMITGLFGNTLVIFIFIRYFERSVMTCLLIVLAFLDLLNCSLAMPFEIVDMRYKYTFPSDSLCKGFRFLIAFPNVNLTFVLLIITVDRYKRACLPLKPQMNLKEARLNVVCSTSCALLMAFPALYLYGVTGKPIYNSGVQGFDCTIRNNKRVSFVSSLYHIFGISVMVIICIALCVMYMCIWREVRSHTHFMRNNTQLSLTTPQQATNTCEEGAERDKDVRTKIASGGRMTLISFLVTLLFVVSNVPFAVTILIEIVLGPPDHLDNPVWFAVSNVLIRSYFISSVGNPIIYGFMSPRFRNVCYKLWVKS